MTARDYIHDDIYLPDTAYIKHVPEKGSDGKLFSISFHESEAAEVILGLETLIGRIRSKTDG